MNEDHDASELSPSPIPSGPVSHGGHRNHRSHGWMMVLCCIPMVVAIIFIVLGR